MDGEFLSADATMQDFGLTDEPYAAGVDDGFLGGVECTSGWDAEVQGKPTEAKNGVLAGLDCTGGAHFDAHGMNGVATASGAEQQDPFAAAGVFQKGYQQGAPNSNYVNANALPQSDKYKDWEPDARDASAGTDECETEKREETAEDRERQLKFEAEAQKLIDERKRKEKEELLLCREKAARELADFYDKRQQTIQVEIRQMSEEASRQAGQRGDDLKSSGIWNKVLELIDAASPKNLAPADGGGAGVAAPSLAVATGMQKARELIKELAVEEK